MRRLVLPLLAVLPAIAAILVATGALCITCEPGPADSCEDDVADDSDRGSVTFRGGYERGLEDWEDVQQASDDRIRPVHEPVVEGSYSGRFETRPTDSLGDTDPRSEVAADIGATEGVEQYYRWFSFFPDDLPTDSSEFLTFTQWRADDESDSYGNFMIWGDRVQLRRDGIRWNAPLERGRWNEFIFHVRWSPDASEGFIELCHDGRLVLPRTPLKTMAGAPGRAVENYFKQGLYKSPELDTGVIYHDDLRVGTTLEAVKRSDSSAGGSDSADGPS